MKNLREVRKLAPGEVFEIWRAKEENLPHWKEYWLAKGYKSWEAWRKATHAALRMDELAWILFAVEHPSEEIPEWRGGMFHGWAKFYAQCVEQPPRFRELAELTEIQNHPYVRGLVENFPQGTTLTAIRHPSLGICVVEGMHRACAVALGARNGRPIARQAMVALAFWQFGDLPRLGHWEK